MRGVLSFAILIGLASPSVVHAQATDDTLAAEAAVHFKKGSNAYRAGDLDEAVTELKAAVKLKPTPNGIFALGQALREKGELAAAAHQYRQYLVLAPTGPFADKSKTFLTSIDATLASARKAQSEPPQGVPAEPASTKQPDLEPRTVEVPAPILSTPALAVVAAPKGPARPIYKRWWLWTTVGVVVVVAGVAAGLGAGLGTQPHPRASDTQVVF